MFSLFWILAFLSICVFCHGYMLPGTKFGTFLDTNNKRKFSNNRIGFDYHCIKVKSHENIGEAIKSENPKRRLANLGKKLRSILDLENLDYDLLNKDQQEKLLRKNEILNEMKSLQQIISGIDETKKLEDKEISTRSNVELLEIKENKRSKSNRSTGGLDVKGAPQHAYDKKSVKRAELSSLKRNAKPLDMLVTSGKIPRTLLKMMIFCRVAGSDTCRLLLEMGRVKVNDQVEKNEVALVDLEDDIIEVEGERLSIPDDKKIRDESEKDNGKDNDDDNDEDTKWNRFRKTIPKDYRATLDGGTLIDLTRSAKIAKGTYVDKSAYANKQPFVYGENFKGQRYNVGKSASNFHDNRNGVTSSSERKNISVAKKGITNNAPRRRPSPQRS